MKIRDLKVSRHLDIIDSIWLLSLDEESVSEGYFLFPDNKCELIIPLKGTFKRSVIGSKKLIELCPGTSYIARTRSRGMQLLSEEEIQLLIIKIHPLYLNLFTRADKKQEEIQTFQPQGDLGWKWRQSLLIPQAQNIIDSVYKYLDSVKHSNKEIDRIIHETINLIQLHNGEIRIRELYEMFGICKSTLEQKFNREIGLSPKEFCKIEKLNNFLKNYHAFSNEMTLTQLTFKSGYYDQSHLIKDFRYYVDESPRKFLKQQRVLMQ